MSIEELRDALLAYRPFDEKETLDRETMLRYLAEDPAHILTRENEEAHFTASSWVVDQKREKVLMVFHNIYQSWSWTGGHADGESDLLKVALKEVSEESGLTQLKVVSNDIFSVEVLPVAAHVKRGKTVKEHLHLNCTYLIEADESEKLAVKPDENSAVAWFPTEEAIARCSEEQMRPIYRKLTDKVNLLKNEEC